MTSSILRHRWLFYLTCLLGLILAALPPPTLAAACPVFPYTVPASDVANLINAINCANSSGANDVINLTTSTYSLTAANASSTGLPLILDAGSAGTLTINGSGATIIRTAAGANQFRLFSILSGGDLTLNNLTLTHGSIGTFGGAILNINGILTLNGSTLSGNSADFGGGIENDGGTVRVINHTLSSNESFDGGGAVDNFGGSLLIINSTITGNTAVLTASSGLWLEQGTLTIQNSIVANNDGANNCLKDGGTFTDSGNNIDNGTSCGFNGTVGKNTNPMLGALADNGGLTFTYALLTGSPAINAGSNAKAVDQNGAALNADQRGAGFARINSGTVDIGAFEVVIPTIQTLNVQSTLQGRTNSAPHASYILTVHVKVMPPGGGTAFYSQDFVTNTSGAFSVPNLPAGTYLFSLKGTHTLARQYTITITGGSNNKTTDVLFEGDADDKNSVVIADFSILAAAFGKALGNAGYDARADFSGDNAITISDFSLLAANFGKTGDGGVYP